jgi:hypothetical protein
MKLGGATNVQCWGTANGPTKAHWLYDVHIGKHDKVMAEMSANMGKPFLKIYQQPSGLLRNSDGTYEPNPLAENIHNLKMGYANYYQQLLRTPSEISAYVMGEFADLVVGKVVYPQFNRTLHMTSHTDFIKYWGKSGEIGATFDFGRTPVCLLYVRRRGGGITIFDEIAADSSSIEALYDNHISPLIKATYAGCWISQATGDPAGNDRTQATEVSPYGVLQRKGVPIEFPAGVRKDSIEPRVEAVRQRLTRLDDSGVPMLQITDNCPMLLEAIGSTYVFEQVEHKPGVFRDTPTKTHKGFASDLANALEYLAVYCISDTMPRRNEQRKQVVTTYAY